MASLVAIDSSSAPGYIHVMQPGLSFHRRRVGCPVSTAASVSYGFTLIELLAALLAIVVLLAIAIPTFDRPRPAYGIHCLNNTKQITLGWIMYASDYQGALMANEPYAGGTASENNWIGGIMDWSASPQNTNLDLLLAGRMAWYVKSPFVYRCPADNSVSAAGPRVRSYSMNAFMNGSSNRVNVVGWKPFAEMSDIEKPAETFVMVDEHANSIDDGRFFNDLNQTNKWVNLPASNHRGAAGFSFADGHSELHKWINSSTKAAVVPNGPKPVVTVRPGYGTNDLAWVLERTTCRDTNSVAKQ